MKTKLLFTSLLLLATLGLSAQDGDKEAVKRYGFKSATAKFVTSVMGQKVESTTFIDYYGALECQRTKMDVPGMGEVESAVITKGNKVWSVNYALKSIQEIPLEQPNFLDLTEDMVSKYKIQEVGKEEFLDKECTVYTMENETQGMKAQIKVWVYKGMGLKQETSLSGMKIVAMATEFKEDAMVLPQVFNVPEF
ncbi:MAG: DUF4412 domain-containing protein [Bacteroidales bacterium]|nr:DUF4412 domain-containing protein [Bacteroidales bacterium]